MQANADRLAAGAVALRKDIYNLTADELAAYREAIQKVMQRTDNKGYNYLAGIHGVPQFLCVHHQWNWLPWHRAYLYLFVSTRGRQERDFSLSGQYLEAFLDIENAEHLPVELTDDGVGNDPVFGAL